MTPVGHTLTGLAIGMLVTPRDWSSRARLVSLVTFAALANAPDWPLPSWGHSRYEVSHSVVSTAVGCSLAALIYWLLCARLLCRSKSSGDESADDPAPERSYFQWSLLAAGVLAWYSHLLLDTFYNHGRGLRLLWPLSLERTAWPIPWFNTLNKVDIVSWYNVRVVLIELLCYTPLLALAWCYRRYHNGKCAANTSGPHEETGTST